MITFLNEKHALTLFETIVIIINKHILIIMINKSKYDYLNIIDCIHLNAKFYNNEK